jgi:hypothetical protein
MSLEVYNRTRDFVVDKLQEFFEVVIAPAEHPEKADFGDVDTLVQTPRDGFTWQKVASSLNARKSAVNGVTHSFAVPIDDHNFAQVDVHVCPAGFIEWECLQGAYGDLWQIVGRFLRPLGLTATNRGLYLRVPEVEEQNRNRSMIYLTHDVSKTLDFLGLNEEQYRRGFGSMEDLYSWCASGKFFYVNASRPLTSNSNDRQRMRKREMFRKFSDEWLPRNLHRWDDRQPVPREQVLQQALTYFGKEKLSEWNAEQEEAGLWSEVSATIIDQGQADPKLAVRGLRRWVAFTSCQPYLCEEPEMDVLNQPRWASQLRTADNDNGIPKDSLMQWVRQHWREVKHLEKGRVAEAKEQRKLGVPGSSFNG